MAEDIVVPTEPTTGVAVDTAETRMPALKEAEARSVIQQQVLNEVPVSDDLFGGPRLKGEPVGFFEGMFSGLTGFGVVSGFGESLSEMTSDDYHMVSNEPMDGFDISEFVKSDPIASELVTEALKLENTDDAYRTLVDELEHSVNPSQAIYRINKIAEFKENRRVAKEAGLVPWLIGAGGSLGLDILASILATGGTGTAGAVFNTAQAARTAAGARLAAFGAAEGALETFAQSGTDPGVGSLQDYAIATGAGALIGGLLGSAFPGFFGGFLSKEGLERAEVEATQLIREMTEEAEGNLSAARVNQAEFDSTVSVDSLEAPTATRGTGSLVADKVLVGPLRALRGPKRRLADAIKAATKERLEGLQGNDRLTAVLSRMYKISTQTLEDQQGIGRVETMQEGLELLQTRLTVHEFAVRNTYESFLRGALGRSTLRTRLLNDDLTGNWMRRLGDKLPSQAEMRRIADQYAQARGEGDLDSLPVILQKLEDRIPAEMIEEYRNTIRKMADQDDDWFEKMGRAEVDLGFIDEKEFGPGYRPQNWDSEYVQAHSLEFRDMIEDLIGRTPDIEWAHDYIEALGRRVVTAEGEEAGITIRRGEESWDELAERLRSEDPELLSDIYNDWDEIKAQQIQDRLLDAKKDLEAELGKFLDNTVEEVLDKSIKVRMRGTRQLAKMNEELQELRQAVAEAPTDISGKPRFNPELYEKAQRVSELNTRIAKLEYRLEAERDRVEILRELQERMDALRYQADDDVQRRASLEAQIRDAKEVARQIAEDTRKGKKGTKEARTRLTKLERDIQKVAGRKTLREGAQEVVDAIAKRRAPGGFHVDDAIQTSRFFKHRQLNLKGLRHKPEWEKFLNGDSQMNLEIYVQSVGRQLEMRRKYMPFLRSEGYLKDGDTDVFMGLQHYITDGFEADRSLLRQQHREGKLTDEALKEALNRKDAELQDALKFNEKAFGEFTRSDYLKHANESFDRVISTAQSATAAMALGKAALTMIADVAIVAFGGSRFGTGLYDLFRQFRNSGVLDEIEKNHEFLAMLLRGERVMANGIGTSRFDLDAPSLEAVSGSKLASIQRTAHSLAQKEMWFNLMHGWNRMIRASFGIGFMRQITKDLAVYDKLPMDLKGWYAKHGIGAAEAKRMNELYATASRNVNGILIPDLETWSKTDSDLVNRFYRAVNGAGNEALLDPGLGDRPFFRANPLGRLIMQFQSFTYAAAERWFSPMVQQGLIRPTDARFLWSGMMALGMAALGNAARDALKGEEPKLIQAIDDKQAFYEVVKDSFIRSPLSIGLMGTAMDVMGTELANPVNDAFQSLTGSDFKPISDQYVRFRQQQGPLALFGPAVGMVGTAQGFMRDILEGDTQGVMDTTLSRAPILNALPWLVLYRLGEQLHGD